MSGEVISLLAVLTAKPGRSDALRQDLRALRLDYLTPVAP